MTNPPRSAIWLRIHAVGLGRVRLPNGFYLDPDLLNTRPRAMHVSSAIHATHPSQASGCVAVPLSTLVPLMTTVLTIPTKKKTPAAAARMTCF